MKGPHAPSPLVMENSGQNPFALGGPGLQLDTGHALRQQPGPGLLFCPLL